MTRTCKICKKTKAISSFPKCGRRNGVQYYYNKCKICYREYSRERNNLACRKYRKNNPKTVENTRLKSLFGITLEERNNMNKLQKQKCAICGRKKELEVDHNHSTGKVRGLLCHGCNAGLGFFEDNTKFLKNGVKYLYERNS